MIRFPFPPPRGFIVELDGQPFTAIGLQPHVTAAGAEITLYAWRAACAECGQPFDLATKEEFSPNRRCPEHRKPGKRVKRP